MTSSNLTQYDQSNAGVSRSGLVFLLAGCGIGAALALLYAPKSGTELRGDISDITRKGYDETLELAQQLKEQSADLYHSIKQSADKVYDLAATKLFLVQDVIDDTLETAGSKMNTKKMNTNLNELDEQLFQKAAGTGRKPSNII